MRRASAERAARRPPPSSARPRTTSTQLHDVHGVEEVHADDALGVRARPRRSRVIGSELGVRRQQHVRVRARAPRSAKIWRLSSSCSGTASTTSCDAVDRLVRSRSPRRARERRVARVGARPCPCSTPLSRFARTLRRGRARPRRRRRRTAASRRRTAPAPARCRGPSCPRRARRPCGSLPRPCASSSVQLSRASARSCPAPRAPRAARAPRAPRRAAARGPRPGWYTPLATLVEDRRQRRRAAPSSSRAPTGS